MRPDRWSHRAATMLAAFAVLGVLHALTLLVLGMRGAPTFGLSLLAVAYAGTAARTAGLLERGAIGRVPVWLALWAVTALAVVGAIGATFHVGPMFWWSALGASLTWLAAGVWLGRRVAAEARGALPAVESAGTARVGAAVVAALPDESMPQARGAAVRSKVPVSGS